MARVREIRELGEYLRGLNDPIMRAVNRGLVAAITKGERLAKQNAVKVFRGTRDRPKTGQLVNSIFAGYEVPRGSKTELTGFVGVKSKKGRAGTKPYGRIQEYGGRIEPVKAQNLWIPLVGPKTPGLKGQFKTMTPRQFIQRMKQSARDGAVELRFKGKRKKGSLRRKVTRREGTFAILESTQGQRIAWFIEKIGRGKTARDKFTALFLLSKGVTMPAKPYITPAVEQVYGELPARLKAEFERRGAASSAKGGQPT